MARHLHFDCFNGISGDMTLGALVDLGLDPDELKRRLAGLPIGEFDLRAEKIKRCGVVATRLHVRVSEDERNHPHLKDVIAKVEAAGLGERPTRRAVAAYRALAEAEARVHGSTPEKIHFHEVGANDAILDVAGTMVGIEMLGVESFSRSTVTVGSGTVRCAHGAMPVPAPATAELLRGMATRAGEIEGELTTPTGAAILRALTGDAGAVPTLRAEAIGYGAGGREWPGHLNCLRLVLGEAEPAGAPFERERIVAVETEIDDMSPELIGALMDRLLDAGARDVQFSPVQMKKNRPGQRVRALCSPDCARTAAELLLRETSTFGVRLHEAERLCLARRMESVETPLGPVAVKVGLWDGRVLKVSPEFEDCRALAEKSGRPLREAFALAERAIADKYFPRES